MPTKKSKPPQASGKSYWQKRLRSREFRTRLVESLTREIELLGKEPVKKVVDAGKVRKALEGWDAGVLDRKVLVDLIVHLGRRFEGKMRKQRKSVLEILDANLVASLDSVLDADILLSKKVEDLIAQTLRQEFVRNLFVEVIHTSIMSFNKRVNPLFGGFTSSMLEGQIKNFIRMFMPMIQEQAVAFAISKSNQRIFLDFTRSIVRLFLGVPLASFASMVSAQQRKQVEKLIKQAVDNPQMEALGRRLAVSVWDDVYAKIGSRKVGDIINVQAYGPQLANHGADLILAGLTRPGIIELVAEEAAHAPK